MKTYNKTLRYVLRSGSFYVAPVDPTTLQNPLVLDRSQAMVLDWRDNEALKARFFSALLSVPFTAEKVA